MEITKPRALVIEKPQERAPVSDGTSYHATVAFQDTVLDPNSEVGELTEALNYYRTMIVAEGEETARAIAASEQLRTSEDFIKQTIGPVNPSLAADQILSLSVSDTALEETSIDNHVNTSAATEEALGPIEHVDEVAERNKMFAHVAREVEKVSKDYGEAGWLSKAGDFAGSMLFWNTIRSRIGLDDNATLLDYVDPLQADEVFDQTYNLMLNSRTYEEFKPKFAEFYKNLRERSGVFGENDLLILEGLERLLTYTNPGVISYENVNSTLDTIDILGVAGGIKAIRSPAAFARATGNLGTAGRLGAPNPQNHLNGVNQMPGTNLSISPQVQQATQSLNTYISTHFDEISKYKNPNQLDQIKNLTEETANTLYPNRVIDVRWKEFDTTGEAQFTEFMDVYLGTQRGTGFSTEDWARNQANAMGIQRYEIVRDPTTRRYLIKADHRPTESRNLLTLDTDAYSSSYWKKWFAGARQLVSDREISTGALGELRTGALASEFKPLVDNILKLKGKEREAFNAVTTKGLNTGSGKWYTDAELYNEYVTATGRAPNQREVDAYHSFKTISDAEWEIRNRALRETLAFENWREFFIGGESTLARLTDRVPNTAHVYDTAGNRVQQLGPNDKVVQLMEGRKNPAGGMPMSFIKLNNTTDLKELPMTVLGRADGGRRFYDADYFIKQDNSILTPEGYHIFNPRIGGATKTLKEAQEQVAAMNDASSIYRQWSSGAITNAQADALLGVHRTLSSLDIQRLDSMVQNKQWDIDKVWEVTSDGGLPKATNEARATSSSIDYTTNISDNVLFSDRIGRMYYSTRGEALKSLETGNPIPTVNVFESLARGVSSAIRTGAWNKYRIEAVNSWVTTVKDLNAIQNSEILNQTPWEILKTAVIKTPDAKLERKLRRAREQILWNIDPSTIDSSIVDSLRRSAREWIYDRDGVLKKYPNLTDFIENRIITNPIDSLRGITFDRHVGMFGPDQLIVQSNTLMTASAIHGMKAATDTIPWTLAMRAADGVRGFKGKREFDSFLGNLAQSHNIPTTELKNRLKAMDSVGVMHVGGEMAQLQQVGNYVETSRVFGAVDKVRQKGRVFFNWAEQNNRLVAFNIAYDMAKKEGLDPLSQRGLDYIALKTQDFSFNMTRSQTAIWQRGWPSVFTQFFGYTGRYMDGLYGKQFTTMQKTKFMFANMVMFGAAGVPFGQNIAEYYGMDETQLGKVMQDGAIDAVLSQMLGVDTAFRTRVSPAQQIEQLAREIMMEGTGALFQTPAGDTVMDMINLFKPAGKVWNLQHVTYHPNPVELFTKQSLDIITDFVTPWNRWQKALFIHNVGRLEDRLGKKVLEDIEGFTGSAVLAAAMGIQLDEVDQLYRQYSDSKIKQTLFLDPMAEALTTHRNKSFWAAVDNDYERADYHTKVVELIMGSIDNPADKEQIIKMAQRNFAETGSREWLADKAELRREESNGGSTITGTG